MADNENPEVVDDVEGHKYMAPAANDDGDDVEGHKYMAPAANDDEDDVEGHKYMGPALSGAVNPDDDSPSSKHTF